jgi:hypothetical protein
MIATDILLFLITGGIGFIGYVLVTKKVSITINMAPATLNIAVPPTIVNIDRTQVNVEGSTINVPSPLPPEIKFVVPSNTSKLVEESHRAIILDKSSGSYQQIGHVDFESKSNPGERIIRELASPNRAILWPDGSIQEN